MGLKRKRPLLFSACLVLALLIASCQQARPGPAPTPAITDVRRLTLDEIREIAKGQLEATRSGVMFDGTADGVLNGGPWNATHAFPRIIATNGHYDVSESNPDHLARVARHYGVLWTPDWPTYCNYSSLPPNVECDPFNYIRDQQVAAGLAANTFKFIAVFHTYQVSSGYCHIQATYPNRCAIWTAVSTADGATVVGDGWYARDTGGAYLNSATGRHQSWGDVDPDGATSYGAWLGNWVVSEIDTATCGGEHCWDGYYVESMSIPHGLQNFIDIDGDENGVRDGSAAQWDKCTVNTNQMDGYNEFFDILATGGITVAGGESEWTGLTDALADSYLEGHATANFNGSFLQQSWPRCAYAPYSTSGDFCVPDPSGACGGNKWDFNMREALRVEDAGIFNVLMNSEDFWDDSFYTTYVATDDDNHQRRLVLISGLMTNGYVVINRDQVVDNYPCDECLVSAAGASGIDIGDLGWLGYPYYDAINTTDGLTMRETISNTDPLNGLVWMREFSGGLAVINTTTTAQNVVVGSGWKYIAASSGYGGDTTHNPGGAAPSTISVPAYDGYVLVRDTAATPTPISTYTPTPTRTGTPPTPTPTRTPTPTVTPTGTPTATPTGVPTATATPTATPLPCATIAVTVDGSLAEWSSRPYQLLNAANAQYINPAGTPSAADLSARLYLGCSGTTLLMAGIITDTVILEPAGDLYNGDAAEIAIDSLADGILRPRQDDHDLFVSPGGTLRDYQYPVPGATVVTRATPGSNWRFEMAVPLSSIWSTIGNGDSIDTVLGLWDRDAATTPTPVVPAGPDQVMIGPRWRWTIE